LGPLSRPWSFPPCDHYATLPVYWEEEFIGRLRLIQHLEDIRKLAANVGHDLSKELEEYVTYMHQFDPTAQDWRYPETKTKAGMQSSKGSIEIDIKHFIEASNRVFDELEDIGWDLSSRENARMMEELGINFSDTE
jgi:hypothetical protein